jgi:hypothetical protein
MTLLDVLFGQPPVYDPDLDPLAYPDPAEAKKLSLHVRQCTRRFADLKVGHVHLAAQLHYTQRLLVYLIIALVASKAIDITVLSGWITP